MRHTHRWKQIRDFLSLIVIPIVIAGALIVPVWIWRNDQQQSVEQREQILRIQCIAIRSDATQLEALASIARELGVPVRFEIPKELAACKELAGS